MDLLKQSTGSYPKYNITKGVYGRASSEELLGEKNMKKN